MAGQTKDTVIVYATTLVHEAGVAYQPGDSIETSAARAKKLVECGIASADAPAPPDPTASPDYEDKMMRLGKKQQRRRA